MKLDRAGCCVVLACALALGCSSGGGDDPRGDALVYWEFIRNAPAQPDGFVVYDASLVGSATGPCPESGVEWVRVTSVAGTYDVDCQTWSPADGVSVQGLVVGDLPAGSQIIRVRGYRGEVVVHDSTVSVTVVSGSTIEANVSVEPVRADLELYAYLAWGDPVTDYPSCAAAGHPVITFAVHDGLGTLVDAGEVPCSDPLPALIYTVPLDLDQHVVRMQGLATSGPFPGEVVFDSCGVGFDHFAPQAGAAGVPIDLLTLPVPTCG